MKPYLIVSGDFVKTGGMDRANYALARYVAERGAETHLVAYRVDPELKAMPNVITHQVRKIMDSYLAAGLLLGRVARKWAEAVSGRGGRVVTNGGNCRFGDVNWVHYVHAAYRRPSSSALLSSVKNRVVHLYFAAQERDVLPRARILIANSNRTRQNAIEKLGIDGSKIHTVHLGTDPAEFRPGTVGDRARVRREIGLPADQPLVVFVGALGDRRKGFDVAFRAWQMLCADSAWEAHLAVVGHGAELPIWRRRASEAGISDRIHFLGFRSDVPDILRASDAMVAPSRYEPYGLAVHEALCCGLPAIVSANAGVAERYPAELRDLLIPDSENAKDVAARIRLWKANPEFFRNAADALSCAMRAYTWNDMAAKIVALGETTA
ncbi:MAG: glycosyltransferase family 4 protein [Candidatus Binatus sp.]